MLHKIVHTVDPETTDYDRTKSLAQKITEFLAKQNTSISDITQALGIVHNNLQEQVFTGQVSPVAGKDI